MRSVVALALICLSTHGCVALDDFGRFSFDRTGDSAMRPDGATDSSIRTDADGMIPPGEQLSGVVAVSVGVGHTCAVLDEGSLVCWGSNSEGELGQALPGGASSVPYPIAVPLTGTAHGVACGWDFTCAIVGAERRVECWGWNDEGQLGDGSTDNHSTPAPVPGITNARLIDAGNATTCVVGDLGGETDAVICWGDNGTGQVGSGSTEFSVLLPEVVAGFSGIGRVSVGGNHACVIDGGQLLCWGSDICGELGLSDGGARNTPTMAVPGLGTVTAVTANGDSTCAISDGRVFCWGNNEQKQTGQLTGAIHPTPELLDLPMGSPVGLVDGVGGTHACARLMDGQVSCWGGEANLLGAGPMDLPGGRAMPIGVTGLTNAAQVSLGSRHSCARRADGSVVCWGFGSTGQLGTGAIGDSFTPVTVVVQRAP
jgi:alpha-tubulin suppressor-like RCC1 family protein